MLWGDLERWGGPQSQFEPQGIFEVTVMGQNCSTHERNNKLMEKFARKHNKINNSGKGEKYGKNKLKDISEVCCQNTGVWMEAGSVTKQNLWKS
jgi:hypothetical protein